MSSVTEVGIISEKSRKMIFEWKVIDFFSFTGENTKYWSPKFHVLDSVWKIQMRPNGHTDDHSIGFLSLYLCRTKNSIVSETVDFSFAIKAANDLEENKTEAVLKCLDQKSFGWHKFIKRSKLQMEKENLVPLGNLTILCTLVVKGDEKHFDARLYKLADDLSALRTSDENSDITLKIEDETISAHKAILAARSPVFSAMFTNDMLEKKTGIVNISDCDLKLFNVFLAYIYTGEAKLSNCDVFHLYEIADKYQVSELMMMCIDFMIRNLSIENVCETFVFSHEIKEEKLQSFIQHFFCKNVKEIIPSDAWKSLMKEHCDLANNLLLGMARKVKIVW